MKFGASKIQKKEPNYLLNSYSKMPSKFSRWYWYVAVTEGSALSAVCIHRGAAATVNTCAVKNQRTSQITASCDGFVLRDSSNRDRIAENRGLAISWNLVNEQRL